MIPTLYGGGAHPGSALSGTLTIPAGDAVAVPILVTQRMVSSTVTIYAADTTGDHALEAAYYPDSEINGLPAMACAGTAGTWTYTATAAAVRTGGTSEVELWPGGWWLVIRNRGASDTKLGCTTLGPLGGSVTATATLDSLADSLAGVSWTMTDQLPLVRADGTDGVIA